ncbi:hypothetical protein [Lysobacter sp. A3-1-A15]|uniref:hypothetical protein n=1 Tax=Novilysobacter viscosus TaxID=3098602 RepID=UPI002ED9A3DA
MSVAIAFVTQRLDELIWIRLYIAIINSKPEHLDEGFNPNPSNLAALGAIFDDEQHPYYEHRLAA